jgi:HlyD family secretion protein
MVLQYLERKTFTGDVLKKERDEAHVKLEQVERDQIRANMLSPVDGVVLERVESNERHLEAGTVLVRIGDMSQLEVEAEVLSQDVVNVKPGHRAEIYGPAVGSAPVAVTVDRVFPAGFTKVSSLGVEQQRVRVILRFDSQSLERLRTERQLGADYRVRVRIFTAGKQDAVIIPRSALFRSPAGDWQVFAIRGSRAALVTVKVGLMNDERVEVVEGIEDGEDVILAPETSLDEGMRVSVRGTTN